MAAFSFPQNPTDGQKVTNADTGVTYVYQTIPGKWDVQVKDFGGEFVDITGDTMTGPLKIFTDEVNTSGNLCLKSTSLVTKNLNHLIYCESTNGSPMFGITNDGFVTTHHNLQCTSSTAFFTSGGSPNNTPGYCAFSILGPAVGDTTNVPYPSRLSPILRTWYNFDGTGTEVRYFGMIDDSNAIVNKAYVDSHTLLEGGIINADGGTADTSGNLIIKQGATDDQTGRLYLKGSNNTTNISLYGASGGIDMKGNLSFNSTNNTKNIRAYGASSPVIKFLTGADASSVAEQMSISSSGLSVVNTISTAAATPIDFTLAGKQTININKAGSLKFQTFINGGGNDGNPTDSAPLEIITAYNTIPTLRVGPAINFNAQGTTTITNGGYSVNYLLNNKGLYFYKAANNNSSDLMFTLNGDQNSTSYGIKAWMDILVEGSIKGEAPAGTYGLAIDGSAVTTNQLWTTANPATFAIKTASGNTQGQHTVFVYGGNNGNTYAMRLSKNNGLGTGNLNLTYYATCDSSGNTQCYAYTSWGSGYSNVDTMSDNTIVTLGVLRSRGLLTTATYTSAGTYDGTEAEHSDTLLSQQSSASIPAQCTFDAMTSDGTGFQILGKTTAQPTNSNARLLQTNHFSAGQSASIEYFGSCTTDNSLVTKTCAEHLASEKIVAGGWEVQDRVIFNKGIRINTADADTSGAVSFHLSGSNVDNGAARKAYFLFMGAGKTDGSIPAEYVFGRDTVGSNISAADNYFTLFAPYGNSGTPKTVFTAPIEVPAPVNAADAARLTDVTTSVSSLKTSIHSAVNSSTDYASLKAALLAALA